MDRLNRRTAQLEGELKGRPGENLQNLRNNPSALIRENNAVVQGSGDKKKPWKWRPGITLNASRTEYVSGSGARESSQPEAACRRHRKQTHPAQQPDAAGSPDYTEAAGSVTAGVKPRRQKQAGNGRQLPAQAAATAAPPLRNPLRRRPQGE